MVTTSKYQYKIDINNSNNAHTLCINMITDSSSVLDVGCAGGVIGEYLNQKKGCRLVGIDVNESQLVLADSRNCYEKLFNLDLNIMDSRLEAYRDSFDFILLADVIEHVYNPSGLIENLKPFLKKDGFFVFSIPNISHGAIKLNLLKNRFKYTPMGLLDETHIRFFTLESFLKILESLNLEIIDFKRVYTPLDRTYQSVNIREYPKPVIDFITKDFESFVYQYVIKAKQSSLRDIAALNQEMAKVTKEEIKSQKKFLKNNKKKNLKQEILKKKIINKFNSFKKLFINKKNLAVIVIPIYKEKPDDNEIKSLNRCLSVLSGYDIIFTGPANLKTSFYQDICRKYNVKFRAKSFEDSYFREVSGYNELLKKRPFYKEFLKYKYMLIYQLDAYVFRNELEYWCNKNYDYIGAPWFENYSKAAPNSPMLPYSGNGGFSLRKIKTLYNLFSTDTFSFYTNNFLNYFLNQYKTGLPIIQKFLEVNKVLEEFSVYKEKMLELINKKELNEDILICNVLRRHFNRLKIARAEEAKYFSFENMPGRLFKQTNHSLPFGCHAWNVFEPDFWEKFIN